MTFSSQQIEAITQSVLRELRSRGVSVAGQNGTTMTSTNGVTLNGKVITEDCLIAANAAGQSISLPDGAIITPSGQDYIRRNKISVGIGSPSVAAKAADGSVIVVGTASAADSAAKSVGWSLQSAGCDFDAARKARATLPQASVCCSSEPAIVACLLNRDSSVRAAVITRETNIETLTSVMNPHVTCLNPAGWSFAALLRLFRKLSNGTNAAPADWKELR